MRLKYNKITRSFSLFHRNNNRKHDEIIERKGHLIVIAFPKEKLSLDLAADLITDYVRKSPSGKYIGDEDTYFDLIKGLSSSEVKKSIVPNFYGDDMQYMSYSVKDGSRLSELYPDADFSFGFDYWDGKWIITEVG